jgi:hypothetical protein
MGSANSKYTMKFFAWLSAAWDEVQPSAMTIGVMRLAQSWILINDIPLRWSRYSPAFGGTAGSFCK